jgi:transcriptional regulator with GAF, ATPase, and Fis domain
MSVSLNSSHDDPLGQIESPSFSLPIASMVRALCKAALTGPDLLYDVMLKLTLMVDSTAQTYGLATWTQQRGERPVVKWVEGLTEEEISEAEAIVSEALNAHPDAPEPINAGDRFICLVLGSTSVNSPGSAIYGRCVRPLSSRQVKELNLLSDVARLAHAHVALRGTRQNISASASSPAEIPGLPGMVFASRAMHQLARSVARVKDSQSTVLITGESGTGKELVARAIHRTSKRSAAEFIPFNCTAAPSELMESLLFGHKKGAFTGAHADNPGLIRAAEGGTLFLDEIGDLPLSLQPKLLRFLQEGEVQTVGERAPRKVNVRVVAATHKDLEREVREGRFREDLYYRVAPLTLCIPPLRERPEDTAILISHYLTYFSKRNDHAIAGITSEAINALQNYSWPGNVRELAAEIERLVLYTDPGSYITCEHLHPKVLPPESQKGSASSDMPANLEHLLEDFERRVITETLKRNDCSVAKTADALGLNSRQTLYKKLKRLAIDVGDFLQEDTEPGLQLRR